MAPCEDYSILFGSVAINCHSAKEIELTLWETFPTMATVATRRS